MCMDQIGYVPFLCEIDIYGVGCRLGLFRFQCLNGCMMTKDVQIFVHKIRPIIVVGVRALHPKSLWSQKRFRPSGVSSSSLSSSYFNFPQ